MQGPRNVQTSDELNSQFSIPPNKLITLQQNLNTSRCWNYVQEAAVNSSEDSNLAPPKEKENISLSSENRRQVLRFHPEHCRRCVGEVFCSRELCNCAFLCDVNRVPEQVPREVGVEVVTGVEVPVLVSHLGHPLNALQAVRIEEIIVQHAKVLIPQRHPEAMDLPSGDLTFGVQVAWLVCAHGDLRVPTPIH